MSRDYCTPGPPFLYTGGEPGSSGMDCLHPQLRHPHLLHHPHHLGPGPGPGTATPNPSAANTSPSPGPFHHLIHEQAKSLVALQELQHEVGALLEFRDLVIETFPSLRTKMAAAAAAAGGGGSTAAMMLMSGGSSGGGSGSNIPVAIRRSEWEPGIQVRRKLITSSGSSSKDGGKKSESTVQDSGFSTETSSKETHSSAASANSSSQAGNCNGNCSSDTTDHSDSDELWNLLDVIHRKGMRLKDEVEQLQGTLQLQSNYRHEEEPDFQRYLFHGSADDLRVLRRERDDLLDRLSTMEAEVMASRLHTSRLQEDFEHLLAAKMELEDQLQAVLSQRGEVNSRIHDLHVQFVADKISTVSDKAGQTVPSVARRTNSGTRLGSSDGVSPLDLVLGDSVPKVRMTDSRQVAAILQERNPIVLQKHLLTTTVKNQVLQEQLDSVSKHEVGLANKLDKARVENDELKFQLKDKHIELEGTLARVRMLELHRNTPTTTPTTPTTPHPPPKASPDIIPLSDLDMDRSSLLLQQFITSNNNNNNNNNNGNRRTEISTASMKAMSPYPMVQQGLDHSSSTESAHDQTVIGEGGKGVTRRKPSKIPLVKSHPAPKPPCNAPIATPRSRSGGDTPNSTNRSNPSTWRIRTPPTTTTTTQPPPSLTKSTGSLHNSNKPSRTTSLSAKDSLRISVRTSQQLRDASVTSYGSGHSANGGRGYRKTTSPGVRRANTTASGGGGGGGGVDAAKVRHRFSWRSWFPNINGP